MADNASLDQNRNKTLQAVSTVNNSSPVNLQADPNTHKLAVDASVSISGGIASGAIASGALASGSIASGAIVDGADVALGITTATRSTATDTTSVAVIPLLKEISYMEQNPASRAVTNAGTFAVQSTLAAETTKVIGVIRTADGSGNLLTSTTNALDVNIKSGTVTTHPVTVATGGIASGAIASGALASGSIASGALASGSISSGAAVSGAFADGAVVTLGAKADARSTATDSTSITAMQVLKEISYMLQNPASISLNTQTSLFNGKTTVSVTNTAVALSTTQAINGIIVQALAGNTNNVYVGNSGVTSSNGFELQPGQATSVAISNLNLIYVNGTSGDGVCYIGS